MRNFRNEFCRCPRGLRYDPLEETEAMLACLGCEVGRAHQRDADGRIGFMSLA
jgi:hypothetical protein